MESEKVMGTAILLMVAVLFLPAFTWAESRKVRVAVPDTKVQSKPEIQSPVISILPWGSILDAEEGPDGWYNIAVSQEESGILTVGYIRISDTVAAFERAGSNRKEVSSIRSFASGSRSTVVSESRHSGGMEFGLRLLGGPGLLVGTNHINDAYKGISDYYSDARDYSNDYLSASFDTLEDLDPLRLNSFGSLEVFFNINPYAGVGFGFGYVKAGKESGPAGLEGYETVIGSDSYYLERKTFTQKISAIPVTLTFYGGLPLGKTVRITPYIGFGLYLGKVFLDYSYRYEQEWVPAWVEGFSVWRARTNTFGFHGGVNIDFNFTRNLGFFIGIGGLAARFTDLTGDNEWEYSGYSPRAGLYSQSPTDEDVKLWFGETEWELPGPRWYPWYILSANDPSVASWWKNTEPAKISISQLRLAVGIVVYLMR